MIAPATKRGKRKIVTPAGELPADWGWDRIDNLGEVVGGIQKGPHRKATLNPTRYLTVAHVHANRLELDDVRYFEVSEDELLRWKLLPDDLLIVEGNGSIEHVGRTALFRGGIGDCVHQNHVIRVRTDAGRAFAPFLNGFLNSRKGRKIIQSVSSTSSGLRTLSVGKIRNLPVPVPSLPEQHKIADILGTWDDALEKLDALIVAKQQAKQGLMQQLLSGKRRLPGFKTKWKSVRLSSILSLETRPIEWRSDKTLHLVSVRRRSGGLFRREPITASSYKTTDLHSIYAGDLLVSKRQVSHGALAMVRPEFDGCLVSKEYSIFANKAPDRLHMPFLDWLSRTERMWWLTFVASNGVVKEKLIFDPRDFLKFKIDLSPDPEEQKAIAAVLDTCDDELRLLRARRDALDLQKQGLMERLLTGALRVSP